MAKLDDVLARINRQLYQEYKDVGIPAEERLFRELDVNTSKDAMRDAVTAPRILGQVDDRNQSRYGISANASRRASNARRDNLAGAAAIADAGNNAILADEDRELTTLQTLINQGTGLRNAAQNGLGVAAANEQSREAAYSAAKEQHKSNQAAAIGSFVGLGAALLI